MKDNGGASDISSGLQLGERALWDLDSPDYECDCPGPPPHFYLPPPPRPPSLIDSDCSEKPISQLETCEAVPVIDAEYHSSPSIPSLAIILIIAITVVVFLCVGIVLVVLKKRKMKHLFPGKLSLQNHCDVATANGLIYEDIGSIRPPQCPPCQTTLPTIEMIDVGSYPNHTMFSSVNLRSPSPVPESYTSQDLFNPVYEELSNGSVDRGETDSEELPQAPVSEDEFAEDELSLGGDAENNRKMRRSTSLQGSKGNDLCRDVDYSDVDDRSRFLKGGERNFPVNSNYREQERKPCRVAHIHHPSAERRSLDRRRQRRNKNSPLPPPPPPPPNQDCTDFHEGLLLKTLLQFCPTNSSSVDGPFTRRPLCEDRSSCIPNQYESFPSHVSHSHHPKQEIFTTFRAGQGSGKNLSQESSFGSDSGYSNNTSGGKPSCKNRKDCRISNGNEFVLS